MSALAETSERGYREGQFMLQLLIFTGYWCAHIFKPPLPSPPPPQLSLEFLLCGCCDCLNHITICRPAFYSGASSRDRVLSEETVLLPLWSRSQRGFSVKAKCSVSVNCWTFCSQFECDDTCGYMYLHKPEYHHKNLGIAFFKIRAARQQSTTGWLYCCVSRWYYLNCWTTGNQTLYAECIIMC